MNELEAVMWCPSCRVDKYEVRRLPAQNEGVFENVTFPPNRADKRCDVCSTNLERR